MAMLASKSPYPAPLAPSAISTIPSVPSSLATRRRIPEAQNSTQDPISPVGSELSDPEKAEDAKRWDEERVCDWLRSVNCGEYEKLFRNNNINGENLLEMDKAVLQEVGIEKIGDRVRLFLHIKKLRTKAYANQKKRNRESVAGYDTFTPLSSDSPRPLNTANRSISNVSTSKRYSKQFDTTNFGSVRIDNSKRSESRSISSLTSETLSGTQSRSYTTTSPPESTKRENPSVSSIGSCTSNLSAQRRPSTPELHPTNTHATRLVQTSHTRGNGSIDGSMMGQLPYGSDIIRVITSGGASKSFRVGDCNSYDEVMRMVLRKFGYREDRYRNYHFYVLDGLDPDPSHCRQVPESELWKIIKDTTRSERNRLILRKIHEGEPRSAELQRAAAIAMEEASAVHNRANINPEKKNQSKISKALGDAWRNGMPHSFQPVSYSSNKSADNERERNVNNAAKDLERAPLIREPSKDANLLRPEGKDEVKKGSFRQFFGARPPSELITSDLSTYFPNHPREQIDRTARLSLRRSTRLSKVNSRLSVASNFSYASSIENAPPMPTIADVWLAGNSHVAKVTKPVEFPRANISRYRDSTVSSLLEPLQEEASDQTIRKSFASSDWGSDTFGGMSGSSRHSRASYSDDRSTDTGSPLRDISQALNDDDEEEDLELQSFLAGDSWDDSKWMKGALIGQGSFGSVYIALHAVTGELLAVKQVEAPSPGTNSATDSRKKSMIDALKREISLLRDLQHPNIVQYLGASSSNDHLNIFLEYVPGGSVQTMLNSYGVLREPLIRNFVRQIVTGLAYLHGREIIHRDIKGANILVDNKGGIKISDFGISKKMEASNLLSAAGNNKNRSSLQGSVFWMAPEVVKQTSYTLKADIWSLGCLVVEMMTGTHPHPDCSQLQAIFKIGGAKVSPKIPDHASSEAQTFLKNAFEVELSKRPTAEELLISPFLNPMT